jgi:Carboxypeptidase regulatory-like domain/TonB dependent receptor/TonB-dependent Receptor Plug Domain
LRLRALLHLHLLFLLLLSVHFSRAQSPDGTISGMVTDPTGAPIAGAEILVVNDLTRVQYPGKTNDEGIYLVSNLPPGPYRIQVAKFGFKTIIKPDVTLNVQDALSLNFALPLGSVSEVVTIQGGAPLVNTESGSVSTVIGQDLVEKLPLNGRSFNTLLQLAPGVVIAPSSPSDQGQFSMAGQRTSANNFLVDGVSANFGVSPLASLGTSGTGSAQAFSALGGTSSLVSVEALQEFRVETSSFAPEFGHTPGGQVLLTTRSGTNDLHGGIYEYFRNDVLDANDWFANQAGKPRAPERHNDFGGFLGGPLKPDHTFFFVSYEGVRLRQPNTMIVEVPSVFARNEAPAAQAVFLNAYPLPDDQTPTPGVYTGPFTGNYSNPSTLNAGSIRIDHSFNHKYAIFGRYNEAPSLSAARNNNLSENDTTEVSTRTVTIGATLNPNSRVADSLRGNFSQQTSSLVTVVDSFGGAIPPPLSVLGPGLADPASASLNFITFDTSFYSIGPDARNRSRQLNFADDLGVTLGSHLIKFGVDYREISTNLRPYQALVEYIVNDVQDFVANGQALLFTSANRAPSFRTRATSLYGQDTWKVSSRFTMTYGLRWELNPPPAATDGTLLAAWRNTNDPANLALAPFGSSLWGTSYGNFAPRLGVAYSLTPNGDLVLRAGWGIFYDLGTDAVGYLGSAYPNVAANCCANVTVPVNDVNPFLPTASLAPPFPDGTQGFSQGLKLPRSYQWNLAIEKSFGGQQALSVTYVGQAGRDLLRQEGLAEPNSNFLGAFLLTNNTALSNYHALQIQYRKPFSSRIQALVNYSYSHSLDSASNDSIAAISSSVISSGNDYASSSFDARHVFSGAVTFAIPGVNGKGVLARVTNDWSVETLVVARSGFPFNGSVLTATIGGANPRPDRNPNQPVWIPNANAGGGKSLNPLAFTPAPAGQQGTEGRNDIPGFGLTQVDFSLGRKFSVTERIALQFRADAFNLFNHPNFTNPLAYIGLGPTFLESPSMANQGLGGLNAVFQQGGPRSLQLSLKLSF